MLEQTFDAFLRVKPVGKKHYGSPFILEKVVNTQEYRQRTDAVDRHGLHCKLPHHLFYFKEIK